METTDIKRFKRRTEFWDYSMVFGFFAAFPELILLIIAVLGYVIFGMKYTEPSLSHWLIVFGIFLVLFIWSYLKRPDKYTKYVDNYHQHLSKYSIGELESVKTKFLSENDTLTAHVIGLNISRRQTNTD